MLPQAVFRLSYGRGPLEANLLDVKQGMTADGVICGVRLNGQGRVISSWVH